MTDQTLPATGGSWIRQKDGSLTLDEAPTALEAAVEAVTEGNTIDMERAVETPLQGAVQRPAKSKVKEA